MYEELPWEQPFLAALAELGIVTRAARAANVGKSTVDERRRKHPEFRRRFEQAMPPREVRRAAIARTRLPAPEAPPSNWRALFLEALAETSNVSASAASA